MALSSGHSEWKGRKAAGREGTRPRARGPRPPRALPLPRQLPPHLPVLGRLPPSLLLVLLVVLRARPARRFHDLPKERGCHNSGRTCSAQPWPARQRMRCCADHAPDCGHAPCSPASLGFFSAARRRGETETLEDRGLEGREASGAWPAPAPSQPCPCRSVTSTSVGPSFVLRQGGRRRSAVRSACSTPGRAGAWRPRAQHSASRCANPRPVLDGGTRISKAGDCQADLKNILMRMQK